MKNILIYFSLLIFAPSIFSQNLEKNFIDQNYIEVTGTAEMELIPNEIKITISVNEKDFKTRQAFTDYEKQMISKLQDIGISIENEFTVLNMNSHLKISLIGANNTYSTRQYMIIVHDTQKANQVFDEMEKMGISSMAITGFDHSEIEKYRLEVKKKAIKAAKDKAATLTEAIDQNIGRALYINELNNNAHYPGIYNAMQSNIAFENDSYKAKEIEQVNFQKIKLKYSVLVKFELK